MSVMRPSRRRSALVAVANFAMALIAGALTNWLISNESDMDWDFIVLLASMIAIGSYIGDKYRRRRAHLDA